MLWEVIYRSVLYCLEFKRRCLTSVRHLCCSVPRKMLRYLLRLHAGNAVQLPKVSNPVHPLALSFATPRILSHHDT